MSKQRIRETLERINWERGRGRFVRILNTSKADHGIWQRQPFGMRMETRSYRIRGNRLFACGTSRLIETHDEHRERTAVKRMYAIDSRQFGNEPYQYETD